MCAQGLTNAQGADAPVAGSLSVWQLFGDKDEGEWRSGTANKVGARNDPTGNVKRKVGAKDGTTKLKTNANCCVEHLSRGDRQQLQQQ